MKQSLNLPVSFEHHDEKLANLVQAATEEFERDTDRICVEQELQILLDGFPADPTEPLRLYKKHASSIVSIGYLDAEGVSQTVPDTVYSLSLPHSEVYLAYGQDWPSFTRHRESVVVTFTAGVTDTSQVPREYKQLIALKVGYWFVDPADERQRDQWKTSYTAGIASLLQEKAI